MRQREKKEKFTMGPKIELREEKSGESPKREVKIQVKQSFGRI
jgi:hypothetical protein